IRPVELRPPLLCSGRTSDFSGVSRVTSAKSATLEPRRPGVVGLYLRIAMRIQPLLPEHIDAVAVAQRHDCALDVGATPETGAGALALAHPVERVHVEHLDLEYL